MGGVFDKLRPVAHRVISPGLFTRQPKPLAVISWFAFLGSIAGITWLWARPYWIGNVALDTWVILSSSCDSTPEDPLRSQFSFPAGRVPSPRRLVDGFRNADFDVCTSLEERPWIKIDLLTKARLEEVRVYGRYDCCWGTRDLPLALEVSLDDVHYERIAVRTLPFTREDPWVVELDSVEARMLRLQVDSPRQDSSLVLSEVEVFGEPLADL